MDKLDINLNFSNDIEREIVSAVFNREDVRSLIFSKVKIDNFIIQNNRLIYRLIKEIYEENNPINLLSFKAKIIAAGVEEPNELVNYFVDNILPISYVDNIDSKIEILINKSTKIKIENLAKKIIDDNEIDYLNPDAKFDSWYSKLDEIINSRNIGELELINDAVDSYQHKLEFLKENKGKLTGTTSGFVDIDKLTNGFQNGDLIILAARPSMGKTALAINFLLNAAEKAMSNESVVFFSLEMSKEQVIERMTTKKSGIDAWKVRTGTLDNNDLKAINVNLNILKALPIYIEDKPNMTILEIESRLRQLIQNSKVKLVVIDYLQLIESTTHNSNRVQEVAKISRKLKIMARELNVPIIAIAQLSRKIEERKAEDRQPMLSDLRESGSIEQDADLVTFIDYDRNQVDKKDLLNSKESFKSNDKSVLVVFYVEKHRNGATGRIKLHFKKNTGEFKDFISV